MTFKHAYSAITANFEIEPVVEDYFKKYPNAQYTDYQIVFKATDEHQEGEFTYIIVFTYNHGTRENHVDFYEFLKSYCTCQNRVATMNPASHILPQLGKHGHTFGALKLK